MAKKLKQTPAGSAPKPGAAKEAAAPTASGQPPASAARRRRWWLAGLLAAAALGTGGALAWRSHQFTQWTAALPPFPDTRGKPPALTQALEQARAQAGSREQLWDAVKEFARLYHANGYRAEAETCWRLLRAQQPDEARWSYYLADLRRTASDYPGMFALLQETVARSPDYAPAWLQLAEQSFKTGDLVAAEAGYRRRLELVTNDPYARLGLARVAQANGQLEAYRTQLERLVRDAPDFPPAHNLLAEVLALTGDDAGAQRERLLGRNAGRFREADDAWLQELTAWCFDPQRLVALGTVDFQTARGDRGRAMFERAVRLDPANPTGHELLGNLYLKLGEADKARESLQECLRLAGKANASPMVFVSLSQAHRALQQPLEAWRVAEDGLKSFGEAPELHNACGAALADLGRHEEAIAAYRRALALNTSDPEANFNLGASLLTVGQLDEALDYLKKVLVLRPRFPQALALLGRIELDAGQLEAAAGYLQPLYDTNPTLPQARQLLSAWHLRSGKQAEQRNDTAAAEQHYRVGLTLTPEVPELNASLGVLCLLQGRFAEALLPLETFRRLRPDDPQSALFLGQVYAQTERTEDARRVLSEGLVIAERLGRKDTADFCREILQHL